MSDSLTDQAAKIGAEHGRNAASWVFDGSTRDDTYRTVLRGIEDGDPAILDAYRTPDLSGEYADDYSEADLLRDVWPDTEVDEPDELASELSDAYNDAASAAFWDAIETACRQHAESAAIEALRQAFPVSYTSRDDAPHGYLPPYGHYYSNLPTDDLPAAWVDLGSIARGDDTADQTSTVLRSNYRSLRRDYPDVWTDRSYANVNALGAFIAELTPELAETLTGLATDYPAYNEEDISELESDEISEQWDDFGAYELGQELPEDVQDTWNELPATDQRDLFDKACQVAGYYPEHNGIEVLWSYAYERTVPFIAAQLGGQS